MATSIKGHFIWDESESGFLLVSSRRRMSKCAIKLYETWQGNSVTTFPAVISFSRSPSFFALINYIIYLQWHCDVFYVLLSLCFQRRSSQLLHFRQLHHIFLILQSIYLQLNKYSDKIEREIVTNHRPDKQPMGR